MLPITSLRNALEEMADALASARLDRLLACEARLEAALAEFPITELPAEARLAVRAEVAAARAALVRCRRLGLSLDAFIGAGLAARGNDHGYAPGAGTAGADLHTLNLTV